MSSKIEVSREQLERWTTGRISLSHLEEIRALLAAPVVERQPVALITQAPDCIKPEIRSAWIDGWNSARTALMNEAPPELAELQATIARLTADVETMRNKNNELNDTVERLKAEVKNLRNTSVKEEVFDIICKERDQFKAEIKRLKAGQGEQFGWIVKRIKPSGVEKLDRPLHSFAKPDYLGPAFECIPVFASQPAPVSKQEAATLIASYLAAGRSEGPVGELARALLDLADGTVAVVLPDVDVLAQIIREVDGEHSLGAGALAERILDKVKELNQ